MNHARQQLMLGEGLVTLIGWNRCQTGLEQRVAEISQRRWCHRRSMIALALSGLRADCLHLDG